MQVLSFRAVLVSWRPPTFGKQNGVIVTCTIVLLKVLSNKTLMYEQEESIYELLMNCTLTMNTSVSWLQQHKLEMAYLLALSQSDLLEMIQKEL